MNIVFCVDRKALPGLHVAAYSLLSKIRLTRDPIRFFIFSDALDQTDLERLHKTLSSLNKLFSLELRKMDAALFKGFPPLNNSWATYYRLAAVKMLEVERFLYVDADTLCHVDVSELNSFDLGDAPAALVPEAPMSEAVDRTVADQLGNSPHEPYYNAGVILINVAEWRRQKITELAMDYVSKQRPQFWDQSALNVVLRGKAVSLDERFNCIANMRKHWPTLRQPESSMNRLIHFLDYPKPWDFLGEFLHPQYHLWRRILDQTSLKGFRSWHATPSRIFPKTPKARKAYFKALKDRLLFTGYSQGWLKQVKGVATNPIIEKQS